MRRKDREITDKNLLDEIIQQADVCHLGLVGDNKPYIVPMSFGYVDNKLYLHSAKQGKKIELIKQNNNVCFEMDIDHKLVPPSDEPSSCTMLYKSVIGFGKAYFVEDTDEKILALNTLMHHYDKKPKQTYNYGKFLNIVQIIRIDIESMTGKIND